MICDVLIVGGGPVGLLAANLLGQSGSQVLVVEKLEVPVTTSRAIGVTPPSLDILSRLGLDSMLVDQGVPIDHVSVSSHKGQLGTVSFNKISGDFPFILSVPQVATEAVLTHNLGKFPSVEVLRNAQWISYLPGAGGRTLVSKVEVVGQVHQFESHFILACDGAKSPVREFLKLPFPGHFYPYTFVMGDFKDDTPWGAQARLFFTPDGAVEAFPVAGGRRRWIVQTTELLSNPGAEEIVARVHRRTGLDLDPQTSPWQSPFGVRRNCLKSFHQGGVFFLGDAAHLMPPIGGQGMNTGFADVADLIPLLQKALVSKEPPAPKLVNRWNRARKRAFRVAADRAWRGMFLGIQTGSVPSFLRNLVLRIILAGPWKGRVSQDYAMRTIPQDLRLQP